MTVAAPPALVPHSMTFEEFLDWVDEDVHAEWVNGEVEFMSPASFQHQDLISFLIAILRYLVDERGLGKIIDQPFIMKTGPGLPGREPDVMFIANPNLHRIQRNYLDGPADLVIEIVSPESQTRDRRTKTEEYRQGGVPEYWTLDPVRQEAILRQLQVDGMYLQVQPDENGIYYSVAMPGMWLNVNWLWQTPLPIVSLVIRAWGLI